MSTIGETPVAAEPFGPSQEQPRLRIALRSKMILGYSLIAFFVAVLTARGLYTNLRGQVLDEFRRRAASIAGLTALAQNADQFSSIGTSDTALAEQFRLANLKIRDANPEITRLLFLRKDVQGFYVVVDAAEQDLAPLGQRYLPGNALAQRYDTFTEAFADSDISSTVSGPALSAYAPLFTASGEKAGVVAVTLDANSVIQKQNQVFTASLLVVLFAVPLGIFFGYVIGNALADPIVKLTRGARELAAGRLQQRFNITTGDEVETLARSFNSMADQLQDLVEGLELRVQERSEQLAQATRQAQRRVVQLETVAQVARTITSVRDLDEILPAITRVIAQQFGYYHVAIFLVDERQEYAVLRAANSAGGRKMLERGHRLPVKTNSIVGSAASLGTPRIALDVGADAAFVQNSDLPETRAELALPLLQAGHVIGVLDVHSTDAAAFNEDELSALNILAYQVGTTIENARLLSDTRAALADARKTSRDLVGRDWSTYYRRLSKSAYKYDGANIVPMDSPLTTPDIDEVTRQGESMISDEQSTSPKMIIPIKLRGEVIGIVNIETNRTGRNWTREEIALAQAAAERAALALENARLVNEAQRRAAKERTIGEISGRLGSLIDIDNIIQTAAQELGRTMPGAEVVIQFEGPE